MLKELEGCDYKYGSAYTEKNQAYCSEILDVIESKIDNGWFDSNQKKEIETHKETYNRTNTNIQKEVDSIIGDI